MDTATPHPAADPLLATEPAAPSRAADYYELTKPRLNFLVIVTTVVGAFIAARQEGVSFFDWRILHAILGTALTAASAAVINQTVERALDARMRRTRNRPIAAGRVTPIEGLLLGAVLGAIGVTYLTLAVNVLTAVLGAATWLIYVLLYTPMKRRSWTNTLIGAITGALPPAMGVTAVTGQVTPLAIALFALLFIWQMPHFYALALMYRDDYADGGFRMLANEPAGDRRTRVQALLYAAALLPISLLPSIGLLPGVSPISRAGWLYAAGAILLGALFIRAAVRCAAREPGSEKKLFLASIAYLPAILAVLMVDQW